MVFLFLFVLNKYIVNSKSYISSNNKYYLEQYGMNQLDKLILNDLISGLHPNYEERCNLEIFGNSKYFSDMIVRVIRYIEHMIEKDEANKIRF